MTVTIQNAETREFLAANKNDKTVFLSSAPFEWDASWYVYDNKPLSSSFWVLIDNQKYFLQPHYTSLHPAMDGSAEVTLTEGPHALIPIVVKRYKILPEPSYYLIAERSGFALSMRHINSSEPNKEPHEHYRLAFYAGDKDTYDDKGSTKAHWIIKDMTS